MTQPRLSRGVITGPAVPGQTGVTLLARVRGGDGQLITAASLTSIGWTVSNLTLGTPLGSGTFAVGSSVFDSLQQADPRWQVDSQAQPGVDGAWGWNFAGTLASTLFALSALAAPGPFTTPRPQQVQCDVVFTPVSGQPWRVVFQWQQEPTYG